jgi:aminoglycoside 3-N-acetyltransferase
VPQVVTYNDILKGFKKLPLGKNPLILVHSSLKSFGYVEGGAETVIAALLGLCGDGGTLVMPALSYRSVNESNPFFDVLETPSDCGIITETFRKMPYTRRSIHVVSSAAAMGEKADYITCFHDDTPCGYGTPYRKVIENDGYCLFIGTGFESNTLFHAAEEHVNPFYIKYKSIEYVRVKGYDRFIKLCSFRRYNCHQTGIIRKLKKMSAVFEQEGVLSRVKLGNSVITLIKARDNFRLCCDVLKSNPWFIIDKSETLK